MITRGSEWSKWDLHLHSKYSKENRTKMEVEDIFKFAVENDIKMISITDHSNVDALDEIWQVYENKNYDEKRKYKDLIDFLPGIELKTDKGKHGVHIICIFPKEILIEGMPKKTTKSILYDNFCSKLNLTQSEIESKGSGSYATGLLKSPVLFDSAIELTHKLGGLVIIHGGDKHGSIEKELNHALNDSPDELYKALNITKTDIMSKKIDLIELPNFKKQEARNARFYKKQFQKACIVGSDSHEEQEYNNLGTKCTWIKSNNSFNGLKQAIVDYENRICLKDIPEQVERVKKNPTKFLDEIKIEWDQCYDGKKGEWFNDICIPLNSGLISIIGNKGNGKSAIAEIIAWIANNKKYNKFAFLNNRKFLKSKLANNFIGKIKWKSNDSLIQRNLAEKPDESSVERVQCIPQQYFEELCTDTELEKFTNEINSVIFSRLSEAEKENEATFDDLIEKYTKSINSNIEFFMSELSNKNKEIINLESKLTPAYLQTKQALLKDFEDKLRVHQNICPQKIEKPILTEEKQKVYDCIIKELEECKTEIEKQDKNLVDIDIEKNDLELVKKNLMDLNDKFLCQKANLVEKLKRHNINVENIISIKLNIAEVEDKITEYENKAKEIKAILGDEIKKVGLKYKLQMKEENREKIVSEEDRNIKIYDEYTKKFEGWKKENDNKKSKIEKIQTEIKYISNDINNELDVLYGDRDEIRKNIYYEKKKIVEIYDRFKIPIDNFLKEHSDLLINYSINIRSGLVIRENFEEELFNYINKKKKNVFRDDQYVLSKTIDEYAEIENADDYIKIPNLVVNKMKDYEMNINEQVKDNKILDFYNYIYGMSYVTNKYELISDCKTLDKLSPGERGALLLIFYLLLDMSDIPLIIDQPEDNLDNQSVAKVLVPFIQAAKKRRQIIMVTHNPNLAVVADSDQIIHVKIDKQQNKKVIVKSGAIEDILINECLVTILEGTMESFKKREDKYIRLIN
ncbi:TrlF family AAA-like ATPase [Clostridium tetani]|uniref:TrlF family AAA-like ATPase n=1 Tax=Clostridium tetani TaxID=1513 RepID=UPI000513C860|nr:PHP domain-containing protein [Clostridium tetani]KGI39512.1 hypothetical protein LA33_02060 [Clostridium tetani ATCC 9441]SUY67026.1 DNA repair ATPase [Clostridium tetani]